MGYVKGIMVSFGVSWPFISSYLAVQVLGFSGEASPDVCLGGSRNPLAQEGVCIVRDLV